MTAGPIMFVLPTLAIGGTERYVIRLARYVHERGTAVVVVGWRTGGALEQELRAAGVEVVILGARSLFDLVATMRLLALMIRRRPAVVHAFLFGFDLVAGALARIARVPVVYGSRREMGEWMRPRHLLVQALGTALVDRVICCSHAVRERAFTTESGSPDTYDVLYNGVAIPDVPTPEKRARCRSALNLEVDSVVVVTVANFDSAKGHNDLLAAIRLLEPGLRPEVRFLWAGDGPLRASLSLASGDLQSRGRLRFLGAIGSVTELLASADLFVLPSRSEGLPNALLEAMAHGLAVVATDVGGVREAIVDESCGVVVAVSSPARLAAAIASLVRDSGQRARLGAAARRQMWEQHRDSRWLEAAASLYRRAR